MPNDDGTHWTTFVHSNQVQCVSSGSVAGSGDGGGAPLAPDSASMAIFCSEPTVPLAKPADGSGSEPDGNIEVAWDLIGPYGESHYNDGFFIFVVTTDFDDPMAATAVTPPIYRVTDPWLGPGAIVIAAQHAFDNIYDSGTLYSEMR